MERRGSNCSEDQNYCSPGKTSQKNPKKSLPSDEWLCSLQSLGWEEMQEKQRKKKTSPPQTKKTPFPFLILNRVTAIYGASPAFNTNLDQMQLQLSSALCSDNWEQYLYSKTVRGFFTTERCSICHVPLIKGKCLLKILKKSV